ncbi:class I SAM-dependent methyltransferase [Reichenbachiella sp.]|uniref:class I SAM-dependent methyltransferase n=1 Tax=Reichenbachiella sp. TaxID=2184521 RepID=UPI003B5BCAD9
MKGKIKANTVDKYLRPIREQICDLVAEDARVLEIGCGNGDLLFRLASKIKQGTGLDIDGRLIAYANDRKETEGVQNLNFRVADVVHEHMPAKPFDYAIASLVFHVLKPEEAHELVHQLLNSADQMIICAFCAPTNWWQRFLLWLDQRFSGHFSHFNSYQKGGYMSGILESLENVRMEEVNTFDPVIKIYLITK